LDKTNKSDNNSKLFCRLIYPLALFFILYLFVIYQYEGDFMKEVIRRPRFGLFYDYFEENAKFIFFKILGQFFM
jgi:hypothetical protein